MRTLVLALALAGCSGSFYGNLPLGWRGTIPTCEGAEVAKGSALSAESTGFLSAAREGRSTLRCKGGSTTSVGVKRVARLAIDGPTELRDGKHGSYFLRAYDADGGELRWADPTLDIIEWSTSWPDGEARVQPAYCHEPIFSCPDADFARLTVRRTGTVTLRAHFAGAAAQLDVKVVD